MSTSCAERSSSERMSRSADVAGLQITPEARRGLRWCAARRLGLARRHIYGEEWVAASPRAGFGQGSGAPPGTLSQRRREGETFWQVVREGNCANE